MKARGSLLVWLDPDMCWHGSVNGEFGYRRKHTGIRAIEVTGSAGGDAPMLPSLLDQIAPGEIVANVSSNSAYDTNASHEAIARRGAQAVTPTRRNDRAWAADRRGAQARNTILDAMRGLGRSIWK